MRVPQVGGSEEPLEDFEVDEPVMSYMTLKAALAAAGPTLVFFALLHLPGINKTGFAELFCERGIVQYFSTYAFFFGVALIAFKAVEIRRQKDAFDLDLLSLEEGQLIRQEDALQYLRRLKRLADEDRGLLLTSRVWHALTRFKLLGSAEKVDDVLKYQGEIDAENAEASYAYIKFLIAVIPILGFLGTVLGISESVGGFGEIVRSAETVESIKTALSNVTGGLGVAFDTTLVALVMSALLMLGLTIIQAHEDTLLGRIEEYCMENVLDRLWVPPLHEQMASAISRSFSTLPARLAEELSRRQQE